jgi:proteasome lid subunit RPN8/RPN11
VVTPLTFSLSPRLIREIVRIGRDRAPNESCGVLLPPPGDIYRFRAHDRQVIELPNRSQSPRDSYEIHGGDLLLELTDWLESVNQEARDSMVIWHTHPSGSIGPSRGDLAHKLQGLTNLVVSLTPGTDQYQTTLF